MRIEGRSHTSLEMEELTEVLTTTFNITSEPNKTTAPHPRFSQYKQKAACKDQDTRRKCLLEKQKKNRFDYLSHVRRLTDGDWDTDDADPEEEKESEESMEVETKLKKPGRYYKDQLMLSEWLVEVPADFASEWVTMLCPVAKRCLVVASRGTTRAFTKSGYCVNSFPSFLPGGYRRNTERETTILDCLFCEATRTYYILDLMCWNGHPVYETETEFRFYWLHEKLKENGRLEECSRLNPYKFVGLPSFRSIQEDISAAVAAAQFEIDGLLFYHKRTHYTFGSTPLVVWLKPYMLEEILGISVPEVQLSHKPADYTNYADHLKQVENDKANNARGRGQGCGRGRGRGQGRGRGRGRGRGKGKRESEMETSHEDAAEVTGQNNAEEMHESLEVSRDEEEEIELKHIESLEGSRDEESVLDTKDIATNSQDTEIGS